MQSQVFHILVFLPLLLRPVICFSGTDIASGSAEEKLTEAQRGLALFDQGLSLHDRRILKETHESQKESLTPRLRNLYSERITRKDESEYWREVVRLKKGLMDLPQAKPPLAPDGSDRVQDAELIARTAIRAFEEIRKEFGSVRPALLHNTLVNVGLKKEGVCWEWAREMMARLRPLPLKTYDLIWAAAREGTYREHNTVVVVSKGLGLSDGLFLDGWKYSGRPFWMRVKDDKKHPWKLSNSPITELVPE